MRPKNLLPKKTAKGWQLDIPASLATNGKRTRLYFPTQVAAEREALPLRAKVREGQVERLLPAGQARIADKAFAMLGDRPPESLIEAVRRFLAQEEIAGRSTTLENACAEYIASRAHRAPRHLAVFERLPRRFPTLAKKLVCEITPGDISKALTGATPYARNLQLRILRSLFNFAIRRDWCQTNPCAKVDFSHVAAPGVPVLSADQLAGLFKSAVELHPELAPLLALEVFAGVRPAEAEQVKWEDIDPADNVLTIRSAIAKTRRARHIALHPQAVAWLDWHRQQGVATTGAICPASGSPLLDMLRAIRTAAGLMPWPQDCLRHTFASAALAAGWRDIGPLCLDLGHTSQAMLHKHYHRAIRKAEAEKIFAVAPPEAVTPGKVVRIAA